MFKKEDIITFQSYKQICDYVYSIDSEPVPGVVHVNMEEIPHFFEAIRGNGHKYIVVSSSSDFGLAKQAEYPPWRDLGKWAQMMVGPDAGYQGVSIAGRYEPGKCRETDTYSARCYAYTAYTFNEIPSNVVRWFLTNAHFIDNSRLEVIPFGTADRVDDIYEVMQEPVWQESIKVYINWTNYTYDRMFIKETYRLNEDKFVTIVDKPKDYKEYLKDLRKHAFTLSPEGNGLDCYRMLEAIYMGSIPIVNYNATTVALHAGLDIIIDKTLLGLYPNKLKAYADAKREMPSGNNFAKLSYWKDRLKAEREKYGI